MPVLAKALCLVILVGMAALIAYGALYHSGPGVVAESFGPFWGRFVWTDVTASFALFAVVVYLHQRSLVAALAMFALMNLLGSAAIAGWLLWRGPDLYRRLRPASAQPAIE